MTSCRRESTIRQRIQLALICAVWIFSVLRDGLAGDWPQWLGPTRNGVSTEIVKPWTSPPVVAWRMSLGSGFSTPVVAGGILFVHAAVAEEEAEEVVALDAKTGEKLWRDAYPRAVYHSELGVGPRATPSVVDGRLYTLGITGVLSCYDCQTGRRIWQTNPYDELKATLPGFGVCSSPLVVGNRVIVSVGGAGNGIVAYDRDTGKIAWNELDEPAAAASPVWLMRGQGPVQKSEVIVQTTLRLVGVDPQDGAIRWEHPLVFEPSGVSPTPLVSGELLICSTQDTGTLALALPTESAAPPQLKWWNQNYSSYFSTGTIDAQGRVFVVTNALMPLPRADIRCLDVHMGTEIWKKAGLGYFHVGLVLTGDGKLLLLDDAGNLSLANAGNDGFQQLCRDKVCEGTFVNPVLSNGMLYARDAKELICLRLDETADLPSGQ